MVVHSPRGGRMDVSDHWTLVCVCRRVFWPHQRMKTYGRLKAQRDASNQQILQFQIPHAFFFFGQLMLSTMRQILMN